ncbi:MAG TPA: hypothetical protein PKC12_03605 [Thiobacillaceae bacterium]|nr:hypothetical protein [Thiobacillaceae bacterium]
MIRKLLLATALLGASTAALAHGGRVYADPYVSFSIGSGPYSGVSMSYSSGGRYWGPTSYYAPAPVVVVPAPHYRGYSAPAAYGHRYRNRHEERRYERRHDRHYGHRHHHYR